MADDQGFYAPLGYSPLWLWAGLLLAALAVGWIVAVLAATRQPRARTAPDSPAAMLPAAGLKEHYLARIHEVETAAGTGALPQRAAHQELSLLLRLFIRDATGQDMTRMTLADIREQPLPGVAEAIGRIYPGEFAAEPLPSVTASAAVAREAVRAWS